MPAPAPTRILVVDDESDIAGLIKHTLERSGDVEVTIVGTGDAALKSVFDSPPDLMILDLNLPVLSGSEVCRLLRATPAPAQLPIIMLTARTGDSDRVSGLDLGADDYITKPFSVRELAARVRAVLRRKQGGAEPPPQVYQMGRLFADFDAVMVSVDGDPVRLTRREFELLKCRWRTATGCCRATASWSASGATTTTWKPGRLTCMWGGFAPNSAPSGARSRPSWVSATDSSKRPRGINGAVTQPSCLHHRPFVRCPSCSHFRTRGRVLEGFT